MVYKLAVTGLYRSGVLIKLGKQRIALHPVALPGRASLAFLGG